MSGGPASYQKPPYTINMPPDLTAPSSPNAGKDATALDPIPPLTVPSKAIPASEEQRDANAESYEI